MFTLVAIEIVLKRSKLTFYGRHRSFLLCSKFHEMFNGVSSEGSYLVISFLSFVTLPKIFRRVEFLFYPSFLQ